MKNRIIELAMACILLIGAVFLPQKAVESSADVREPQAAQELDCLLYTSCGNRFPGRYGWFPSSARSYAWNKVDGKMCIRDSSKRFIPFLLCY